MPQVHLSQWPIARIATSPKGPWRIQPFGFHASGLTMQGRGGRRGTALIHLGASIYNDRIATIGGTAAARRAGPRLATIAASTATAAPAT